MSSSTRVLPDMRKPPAPIGRWAQLQMEYYDVIYGGPIFVDYALTGTANGPNQVLTPGVISDIVGNDVTPHIGFGGDGGPASAATFAQPSAIAMDVFGNLYIAESGSSVARIVYQGGGYQYLTNPAVGNIYTIAGVVPAGGVSQGGPGQDSVIATQSPLNNPTGVAVDSLGNVYIADSGNNAVRMVSANSAGYISTVAGTLNAVNGYAGDGGAATSAQLADPSGVSVDGNGNIYIADNGNNAVRAVYQGGAALANLIATENPGTTASAGNIYTLAGGANVAQPANGDGGLATLASLNAPTSVVADSTGNIYIADYANNAVRRVDAVTGLISSIAAGIDNPVSLAVDSSDSIYFNGHSYCTVLQYNPSLQPGSSVPYLSIVAGNGFCMASGDGGGATNAGLSGAEGLVVDGLGNLYLLEADGVRLVNGQQGILNFGNTNVGSESELTAYLTDDNILPAPNASPVVDFSNTPFAISNNNTDYFSITPVTPANPNIFDCDFMSSQPMYLTPGGSCAAQFEFQPIADGGPYTGEAYQYISTAAANIFLSGSGVGTLPTATLTGIPNPFISNLNETTSPPQMFTLTNTGTSVMFISAIGIAPQSGAGSGYFSTSDTCGPAVKGVYVLNPAGSCTITVSFTGTAAGSVVAALQVNDNASTGGGIQTITLNATVVAPLGEFVSSNGTVVTSVTASTTTPGTSSPFNVNFTNAGTGILNINPGSWALQGVNAGSFSIVTNSCTTMLNSGASCSLTLSFSPTALMYGNYGATLLVQDDSGGQPLNNGNHTYIQQSLILSGGTGGAPPQTSSFSLQNATFPATPIRSPVTQTVTLVLNDASNVISITTAAGSEYTVGTYAPCSGPAGTTCAIPITFTPTGIGTRPGTLIVGNLEYGVAVPYFLPLTGSSIGTLAALTPGIISNVVAGEGIDGPLVAVGTTGPSTQVQVGALVDMAIDPAGNMFLADFANEVIWKANTSGQISIYAGVPARGSGNSNQFSGGFTGDGGPAIDATLLDISAIALNASGGVYIGEYVADTFYNVTPRIRYIDPSTQTITTIAGTNPGGCVDQTDSLGDGCPATVATINAPQGLIVDAAGDLYFSEIGDIRRIDASTGIVSLIAGNGTTGYSPDGTLATKAQVFAGQLAFDSQGNLYFADNQRYVRRIDKTTGILSTITGNATTNGAGYCGAAPGEGGSAQGVAYSYLHGIAFDAADNLYIADPNACVVRRIDAATQTIHTVAGLANSGFRSPNSGYGNLGQANSDGSALEAELSEPGTVRLDSLANLYIAGSYGDGVRKVDVSQSVLPFAGPDGDLLYTQIPFTVSAAMTATVLNAGNSGNLQFYSPFISPSWGINQNYFIRDITDPTGVPDCYDLGVIAPGAECPVNVDFTPQASSTSFVFAQDSVTDNAPTSPQVIQLSGVGFGTVPQVTLTPALVSFSTPQGNSSSPQTLTLTNNSSGLLEINGISITGSGSGSYLETNNCGVQFARISACKIQVTFNPAYTGSSPFTLKAAVSVSESLDSTPLVSQLIGIATVPLTIPLSINELIDLSDGPPKVIPTTPLSINETIDLSDAAPVLTPSTTLTITELIDLSDGTPKVALPWMLPISEQIHISDGTNPATLSMLLPITEAIHVSDGTSPATLSMLLPTAEAIHVSDSPATAPTVIATSSSLQAMLSGGSVTLTVTVTPSAATGTVDFYDGSTLIASGQLSSGSYTYIDTSAASGTHQFSAVYEGNSIYAHSSSNTVNLNTQPTLTITAQNADRAFAAANPALTYQVSGFVNGDTAAVLSGSPVLSTTAVLNSLAGSYPITATAGTLTAPSYYVLNFVPATLTVDGNTPQQITFLPFPPQIPGAMHALTLTAHSTSALPIVYMVSGPAMLSHGSTLLVTGTGLVTVTATQTGNATFRAATPVVQSFEVTP
jgi:streptogramin lyase